GDPARFATKEKFASYNGTAPIEASSGPKARHRLNPRGNRKLNHAMHLIAVTQIGHAGTPGRAFYERKLAEGKTPKEAVRALKRRVAETRSRALGSRCGFWRGQRREAQCEAADLHGALNAWRPVSSYRSARGISKQRKLRA
ncbi:MAG: transposase, partial [Actinobacteria bacterium]|nr:transposase [Actinomycetota bacterium]